MSAPPDVRVWPGKPHRLGATWDGSSTNFALFLRPRRESGALPVRTATVRGRLRGSRFPNTPTSDEDGGQVDQEHDPGAAATVAARSLTLMVLDRGPAG